MTILIIIKVVLFHPQIQRSRTFFLFVWSYFANERARWGWVSLPSPSSRWGWEWRSYAHHDHSFESRIEGSPPRDYALKVVNGGFFGGPYNPLNIAPKQIKEPYSCNLDRPIWKWYIVIVGRCQGIFQSWVEVGRLVTCTSNAKDEAFKQRREVEAWLGREFSRIGRIATTHREHTFFLGPNSHDHNVFHYSCCDKVFCTNVKYE